MKLTAYAIAKNEALIAHVPESIHDLRDMVMTHYPDSGRDRQYGIEPLELGVREEPDNPRRAHYLGREYYDAKRWGDAIAELQRHLSLPGAGWAPERAASARFIAHSHAALKEDDKARDWFEKAIQFDRGSRDAWMDLAQFEFDRKNWTACASAIKSLLAITERTLNYIGSEAPWGVLPYDIGAVAAYYAGRHDDARHWLTEALRRRPGDPRLVENAGFILGGNGGDRVDAPTGWMFA
jgi:tetratricopeptide (TPR) repeat protein